MIRELWRVLRAGGTLVIFDGDYTSLTYAVADHEFSRMMDYARPDEFTGNMHGSSKIGRTPVTQELLPKSTRLYVSEGGDDTGKCQILVHNAQ